jgi:hypothetical protein
METHAILGSSTEIKQNPFPSVQENPMFKNRSFVMLITATLVLMAALLITQALAVAQVVTTTQSQIPGAPSSVGPSCPLSAADLHSIHGVYVKEIGRWLPYTSQGPMGVDGGAIELLSRTCSR